MSLCKLTTTIDGNQCIGDTLPAINTNFSNLDTAVCILSSTMNTSNVGAQATLDTLVQSLSVFDINGNYLGYLPIYK